MNERLSKQMLYPIGLAVSVTLSVINDMAAGMIAQFPASLDRNLFSGVKRN